MVIGVNKDMDITTALRKGDGFKGTLVRGRLARATISMEGYDGGWARVYSDVYSKEAALGVLREDTSGAKMVPTEEDGHPSVRAGSLDG